MGWLITFAYVAMMVITGVLLYHIDEDFRDDDDDGQFMLGIFFCVVWPFTLIGYGANGLFKLPTTIRERRINQLERKRQAELSEARHLTALEVEKANRRKAEKEGLEALGISTRGFELQ